MSESVTSAPSAPRTFKARQFMNFTVTPTSHSLADYRARGGYSALEKALKEMQPE